MHLINFHSTALRDRFDEINRETDLKRKKILKDDCHKAVNELREDEVEREMNLQKIKNNLTNIGIGFILSAIFLKVVGVNGIFSADVSCWCVYSRYSQYYD